MSDNLNINTHTYPRLNIRINEPFTKNNHMQLKKICDMCDGYEPYTKQDDDCDIIQAAAYDPASGSMIGFVGILANEHEYEVTAVTHPDYRKQGIFSTLFSILRKIILETDKYAVFTAALPKYLISTSINKNYLYSELLMKLSSKNDSNKENAVMNTTHSSYNDTSDNIYEGIFSDDGNNYLLYIGDDDEPVAVCDLTYETSFTVISGVFVDLAYRNKGIGTLFMTELISDYFIGYSNPLILHVNSNNKAALRLYERCGFEIIDKIDYYLL